MGQFGLYFGKSFRFSESSGGSFHHGQIWFVFWKIVQVFGEFWAFPSCQNNWDASLYHGASQLSKPLAVTMLTIKAHLKIGCRWMNDKNTNDQISGQQKAQRRIKIKPQLVLQSLLQVVTWDSQDQRSTT